MITTDRTKSLGGSEAASILGLNPHASAFDVWLEKTGRVKRGFSDNRYTYWGRMKEAVIADHYARLHKVDLVESSTRTHRTHKWMTGTPDRLIFGKDTDRDWIYDTTLHCYLYPRGVEIKTAAARHRKKWGEGGKVIRTLKEATGEVPLSYWVQCQWYMEIMDFPEWDLIGLIDSAEDVEYRIERDKPWMEQTIEVCARFWEHVENDTPPPVDGGHNVAGYLRDQHEDTDEVRPATEAELGYLAKLLGHDGSWGLRQQVEEHRRQVKEWRQSIEQSENELRQTQERLDEYEREKRLNENLLRQSIGPAQGVEGGGMAASWMKTAKGQRPLKVRLK
jgi:putative phage-type endonuclease